MDGEVKKIDLSFFEKIIEDGETQTIEFKREDTKDIVNEFCAFANSDLGGDLYVGINDDLSIGNIGSIQIFDSVLKKIHDLKLDYKYTYLLLDDKYILHIHIDSSEKVEYILNSAYIRKGTQSFRCTPSELERLKLKKGEIIFENKLKDNINPSNFLESKAIKNFFKSIGGKLSQGEIKDFLERNSFLQDNRPSNACLLCFSDNPQLYLTSYVNIDIYNGEKNNRENTEYDRLNVSDRVNLQGDIYLSIVNSIDFIQDYFENNNIVFPKSALREAVVNSIIHRDYSQNNNIQINIFKNLIEIKNPVLKKFDLQNIKKNDINPKVLWVINQIENKQNYKDRLLQNRGEGIKTILNDLTKNNLPRPKYKFDDENCVILTMKYNGYNTYGDKIVEYLKERGTITNKEARNFLLESDKEIIKNEFKKLLDKGIIEKVDLNASKSKTSYKLVGNSGSLNLKQNTLF